MDALRDISGYRFFSAGDTGAAHAAAHRALDSGDYREGHRQLAAWLEGRTSAGSQWVHVQWHMLVFEIAVGEWGAARARFDAYILPSCDDAATDAPAGLWRLALSAPGPVDLPWAVISANAASRLGSAKDRYVELHHLLALAGAGDTEALERWVDAHPVHCEEDCTLHDLGRALLFYSAGIYADAARALAIALPGLPRLGGSHAQNALFTQIQRRAAEQAALSDRIERKEQWDKRTKSWSSSHRAA